MNRCDTLRENLKAYLDGELPLLPRTALRLHLARCASCREEIRLMEQIGNDLRAGDAGSLEPALRAKLLSGIPDTASGIPAKAKRFARFDFAKWKRKPMLLWGAATAAALVWFTFQVTPQAIQRQTPFAADKEAAQTGAKITASQPMMPKPTENTPAAASAPALMPPAVPASGDFAKLSASDRQKLAQVAGGAPGGITPNDLNSIDITSKYWQQNAMGAKGETEMAKKVAAAKAMLAKERAGISGAPYASSHQYMGSMRGVANETLGVPSTRQVHREADITVEVAKLEESSDAVEQMVKTAGGYVASNEISTGDDGLKSASLTTKIPVTQFDIFLGKVSKLGDVKAKNVTGEDITEQISDEAQAKRVLKDEVKSAEARLREARTRSQRREDMETISDLKVQKAQAQARLEMLSKSAALSDVTVELREKTKPAVQTSGGFLDEVNETGHAAVQSFLQAARLPILLLVWLVAYAPIWILLAIAYRYAVRS